jgi:Tfp pilus assembly protein PilF
MKTMSAPQHQRERYIPIILVGAVVLTFGAVITHDFVTWDDILVIAGNPRLNPPTAEGVLWYWRHGFELYIPVTYTLWAVLASIGGVQSPDASGFVIDPWIFHATSVLLHALSVLVAYAILKRLSGRAWAACAGALVFGLHPVQAESVAWAAGMKDVLAGLLSLVGLWLFLNPKRRLRHLVYATLAFTAAILAKPTAIVVPFIAVVIDTLLLHRLLRESLKPLSLWFILALCCILWTGQVHDVPLDVAGPTWARSLIAGDALAFYLWKLVWPFTLAIDYGRTPRSVLGSPAVYWLWLIPAAIVGVAWVFRKRSPWLLAGTLVFVLALLPVLGFVPFQFQSKSTVADHYLYLAMFGVAIVFTHVVAMGPTRSTAIVVVVLLIALAMRTWQQTRSWRDDLALFQHTLAINPQSWAAHNNLGLALARAGQPDQAVEHYAEALRLRPAYSDAHNNLVTTLTRLGRIDDAAAELERWLALEQFDTPEIRPKLVEKHYTLGRIYLNLGRPADAARHFEEVLRIVPNHPDAAKQLEIARRRPSTTQTVE